MHSELFCVFALLFQSVSSHVLVTNAYGNADPKARSYGLGLLEDTNRQDGRRFQNQRDCAVFSDPTMAPDGTGKATKAGDKWFCKKCPIYDQECAACNGISDCKKCPLGYDPNCSACRKRKTPTCGRTYYVGSPKWYTVDEPELQQTDPNFPHYNTAQLNTETWTEWMVEQKLIAKVTAGGWLNVTMAQQNTDGGGPYMCELDESGTGTNFTPLTTTGQDSLGRYGANLCKNQDWYVGAILPKNLNCQGTSGGLKKICMVRCMNDAPNGPFGGCIPVQQVDGPKATFPPLRKQNFCLNGMETGLGRFTDQTVRVLAGNFNLKQADIAFLVNEVGGKRA